MVGLIQEQHPDRCRLFMQWKKMDWPVMVDALNLLDIGVVPVTVLIDEHGVVRDIARRPGALESFLKTDFESPEAAPNAPTRPDIDALRQRAEKQDTADHWRTLGNAIVLWGEPTDLGDAIQAYRRALEIEPDHGPTHFRLGVAYRMRFESGQREPGDFERAIAEWKTARGIDPNQYIWRRRIQQYGPRLDKPYSFYDWVHAAREEIRERGETPVELSVEPSGAEFAVPARSFSTEQTEAKEPDPEARIHRDKRGFIEAEAIVVPSTDARDESIRVHLLFRPNEAIKAHWNNEAEPMRVWIEPPDGWRVDRRLHVIPNVDSATSNELRRIEVELRPADGNASASTLLRAYALYNVCEDVDGVCLYRRKDVEVPLDLE